MVSSSLATEFHSSAEAAAAAAAGLVVPMTEDVAAASAAAAATFMQWEYLDANTIRTYEIPVHIGGDTTGCYESFTLPQGFTPIQQFPYVSQASVAPPPPPPPSTAPSAAGENHSILIQRVPHRSRKGRGINFPTMTLWINFISRLEEGLSLKVRLEKVVSTLRFMVRLASSPSIKIIVFLLLISFCWLPAEEKNWQLSSRCSLSWQKNEQKVFN